VATTGEFIYHYFSIFANSSVFYDSLLNEMVQEEQNSTNWLLENRKVLTQIGQINFASDVIGMLQIGLQTFLILNMSKSLNECNFKEKLKNFSTRKKSAFIEFLWYVCVCNVFKWVTDSFIEGHFLVITGSTKLVFGESTWTAITQASYPLVLFYRFHSGHMIFELIDNIQAMNYSLAKKL